METVNGFHRIVRALEQTCSPLSCLPCLKSRWSTSAANGGRTWLPRDSWSESQREICMTLKQHSYILVEEYDLNCDIRLASITGWGAEFLYFIKCLLVLVMQKYIKHKPDHKYNLAAWIRSPYNLEASQLSPLKGLELICLSEWHKYS